MRDALIGHTGYVGGTLSAQHAFAGLYRSTNVHELAGTSFDTVYCAGAPGQKWVANANPQQDADNLARLMDALGLVRCERIVLLSTVDVFAAPQNVVEQDATDSEQAGGYGRNRRALESFVQDNFAAAHVVRLPGLVGPGLRKNALYDLRHRRRLETLRPDARFQFYPMVRLWRDLEAVQRHGLPLVHMACAPVTLGQLAREAFGVELPQRGEGAAPSYDMRSSHAGLWGKSGPYQVEAAEVVAAVTAYALGEGEQAGEGSAHGAQSAHVATSRASHKRQAGAPL